MIRLEINPLDQKDIIELLEYALAKKLEEGEEVSGRHHWDSRGYYRMRIPQLIMIMNGKNVSPGIYQSSAPRRIKKTEDKEDKIDFYF